MPVIVIALELFVGCLLPQAPAAQPPRERYEALLKEYEAEEIAWNVRYGGGRREDPEPQLEARYRDWPAWRLAPRFLEIAETSPDDPAAVDSLLWIVNLSLAVGVGDQQLIPTYGRALEILARGKSLDDKRLGEACRHALRYPAPWTEQFLRTLLKRSRNRDVRGMACLALARLIASRRAIAVDPWFAREGQSPFSSFLRQRMDAVFLTYLATTDTKQADEDAERLFKRAIDDFGSVVYQRSIPGVKEQTIAEVARSERDKLRKPAVGRMAPEIDGEEASGGRMKLSDYRGKIVVLGFLSAVDPRCRETFPQLHRLLDRFKNDDLALVSVDIDADRERLARAIKEGEITWKCWLDRGFRSPIATSWGVTSTPAFVILDRAGVIRSKDLPVDRLASEVAGLLQPRSPPLP